MNIMRGFTLIEILLSIACLAIIASISIPVYQSFQNRNDLNIAANTVAQSLRRAQILAQAAEGDTSAGVKIETTGITIFRGPSFLLRDSDLDEFITMSASITTQGLDEIVFSKFAGLPGTTGSIILNSNINETKTITINEKGMVSY
jgi:prepilin-type N-terminal cleavage/methylation domain-containing protein